jgi:hypothetical protein
MPREREDMRLKLVFAFLLITISNFSYAESRKLSADEVKEVFTDKTIKGENYMKGMTVRIYAGPNGEWISNPGGMKMIHFKWSVNSSGEHCKKGKGQQGCGPVISKGEPNVYYKKLKGEERFKFTVIGDGNQL